MTPRELVEREVIYNLNTLVSELSHEPNRWQKLADLGLFEHRVDNSDQIAALESDLLDINDQIDDLEGRDDIAGVDVQSQLGNLSDARIAIETQIEALQDEEGPSEVYEHWLVTDWLAHQLRARGESVGEFLGLTIWGRCTTGQPIYMDEVIQEIAA